MREELDKLIEEEKELIKTLKEKVREAKENTFESRILLEKIRREYELVKEFTSKQIQEHGDDAKGVAIGDLRKFIKDSGME